MDPSFLALICLKRKKLTILPLNLAEFPTANRRWIRTSLNLPQYPHYPLPFLTVNSSTGWASQTRTIAAVDDGSLEIPDPIWMRIQFEEQDFAESIGSFRRATRFF